MLSPSGPHTSTSHGAENMLMMENFDKKPELGNKAGNKHVQNVPQALSWECCKCVLMEEQQHCHFKGRIPLIHVNLSVWKKT